MGAENHLLAYSFFFLSLDNIISHHNVKYHCYDTFSVCSFTVLCKDCSSHNPKSCNRIMLIDHSKLSIGVNVSMNGSLSLYVSLLINC